MYKLHPESEWRKSNKSGSGGVIEAVAGAAAVVVIIVVDIALKS